MGRLVDPREHRIKGDIYIGRPLKNMPRDRLEEYLGPKTFAKFKQRLEQIEALKASARRRRNES